MKITEDKALGSMLGFAIGDAWGATTEFMTDHEIRKAYGQQGVTEIIGGGWLKVAKGQVTDDTEMMLCVAEAIVENRKGSFDDTMNSMVAKFIEWFDKNPIDVGHACKTAIGQAKALKLSSWQEWSYLSKALQAGQQEYLGNGALMRALPCFLLLKKPKKMAVEQAFLTHCNKTSRRVIIDYIKILQGDEMLLALYGRKHLKPTGHMVNTLCNACYYVLHTSSYYDAVYEAVNDGGDADTIAAITGSIAGLKYGFSELPLKLLSSLSMDVRTSIVNIIKKMQ